MAEDWGTAAAHKGLEDVRDNESGAKPGVRSRGVVRGFLVIGERHLGTTPARQRHGLNGKDQGGVPVLRRANSGAHFARRHEPEDARPSLRGRNEGEDPPRGP